MFSGRKACLVCHQIVNDGVIDNSEKNETEMSNTQRMGSHVQKFSSKISEVNGQGGGEKQNKSLL